MNIHRRGAVGQGAHGDEVDPGSRHLRQTFLGYAAGGFQPGSAAGEFHRLAKVAATGVNFISMGALTHSAPAVDIHLRLIKTWR